MEKINIYLSKYRACVLFKPKYMSNPTSFGLKKKRKRQNSLLSGLCLQKSNWQFINVTNKIRMQIIT